MPGAEHPHESQIEPVSFHLARGAFSSGSAPIVTVDAPVLEVGVLEGVPTRPGEREHPAEVAELVADEVLDADVDQNAGLPRFLGFVSLAVE